MSGLAGHRVVLGALLLLRHQFGESLLIDVETCLRGHLEREIDRESVCVVQGERVVTADRLLVRRLGGLRGVGEQLGPGLERLGKRRLLADRDGDDMGALLGEFGVRRRHDVDHRVHDDLHGRLGIAEQPHGADHAPQESPQHVTASVITWEHAVADEHDRGAGVVGDDAEPHVVVVIARAIAPTGQLRRQVDERLEQVGLVDVVDVLQQAGHTLDAHTGVDVLLRQRAEDLVTLLGSAGASLVLHEHEIPDLDVAILVGFGSTFDAVGGSTVVEDLRARAARAGHAHRPVVVLHPAPLDALCGNTDLVAPDRERLVVVEVDRRPELLRVDAVSAVVHRRGEQIPRKADGLTLEVVAEREVARHLEEGVVAGGDADLFDVECADTLLHAGGAVERRGLFTEEVGLERHHACVDEQQVGIVEDQRGTGHLGVSGLDEVIQESLPDLMRLHWVLVLGGRGACTSVVTVGTRARANPTICDIPAYRRVTRTPEERLREHKTITRLTTQMRFTITKT